MQKNWYVAYTKAKCEKKVSKSLSKRRIQNFCPIYCRQINQYKRLKLVYEPLFPSYVFVNIHESQLNLVKEIPNVVNILFYKQQPAIIQNEEVEEIREFITDHQDITLQRSRVNLNGEASILDRPAYAIDGNIVTIKNKSIKINLPSLGYTMIAEMEEKNVMGRGVVIAKAESWFSS